MSGPSGPQLEAFGEAVLRWAREAAAEQVPGLTDMVLVMRTSDAGATVALVGTEEGSDPGSLVASILLESFRELCALRGASVHIVPLPAAGQG